MSMTVVLPELRDGAGEVGGVCQAIVGEALLCVPGVVAALPWQLLQAKQGLSDDQRRHEDKERLVLLSECQKPEIAALRVIF